MQLGCLSEAADWQGRRRGGSALPGRRRGSAASLTIADRRKAAVEAKEIDQATAAMEKAARAQGAPAKGKRTTKGGLATVVANVASGGAETDSGEESEYH